MFPSPTVQWEHGTRHRFTVPGAHTCLAAYNQFHHVTAKGCWLPTVNTGKFFSSSRVKQKGKYSLHRAVKMLGRRPAFYIRGLGMGPSSAPVCFHLLCTLGGSWGWLKWLDPAIHVGNLAPGFNLLVISDICRVIARLHSQIKFFKQGENVLTSSLVFSCARILLIRFQEPSFLSITGLCTANRRNHFLRDDLGRG